MKKILLVGNYNVGNFGDDLLLLALKKHFKDFPDFEFSIMAPGIPRDTPLPPAGIKSQFSFSLFKSVKAIKKSDYILFGGGGLLNPEEPYSLFIWGNVILIAKLFKKPVIMLGQSFSDKYSGHLSYLLSKIDFITVRDGYSLRNLNQYQSKPPVRKCSDLALTLDRSIFKSSVHRFEHENFLVLNLRNFTLVNTGDCLNYVVNVIDYILKHSSYAIYLVPFEKSDCSILLELKNRYKDDGRVFNLPHEKTVCLAAIESCKGVISERLHVGISALICEKPLYILSYSSKVVGLFKDILSPLYIYDLNSEPDELFNNTGVTEFLEKVQNEKLNYELNDLLELKNKSRANLRLVNEFINCSND